MTHLTNTEARMIQLTNTEARMTNTEGRVAYLTNTETMVTQLTSTEARMIGTEARVTHLTNTEARIIQLTSTEARMTNTEARVSQLTNIEARMNLLSSPRDRHHQGIPATKQWLKAVTTRTTSNKLQMIPTKPFCWGNQEWIIWIRLISLLLERLQIPEAILLRCHLDGTVLGLVAQALALPLTWPHWSSPGPRCESLA